jgi:hypothetical protein
MSHDSSAKPAAPRDGDAVTTAPKWASGRDSTSFFRDLAPIGSFDHALDTQRHADVPSDWWVVITDVIGSTRAIEEGRYKNVNTVGVASIAAVCNVDRNVPIPFIFGGDGATFAVPPTLVRRVRQALRGAQQLARDGFGLDLRLGMVPVADLVRQGAGVRIAKVRTSKNVTQAAFSGRGWELAERLVKDPQTGPQYAATEVGDPPEADFTGFECRWQGVKAVRGQKLSLLVMAMQGGPEEMSVLYTSVLRRIQETFGGIEDFHPISKMGLKLSLSLSGFLDNEAVVRAAGKRLVGRLRYAFRALVLNAAGKYLMNRKRDNGPVAWTRYKDQVVANSDFRKFDGMLRMVIDGSVAQANELMSYLDAEHAAGRLAYGMHRSDEALVTCLVRGYGEDEHMHFVDGAGGGYALAARQLKAQLKGRMGAGATGPTASGIERLAG